MQENPKDPDLDHKFTRKHSISIEISEQKLHDQLVAAIEGGGTSDWAEVDVGAHQTGWANYFTATFKVIEETSGLATEGEHYTLSVEKLIRGLAVLAAKYPHHFCDILSEEGDRTTGDVLVQCALFDDIVYV